MKTHYSDSLIASPDSEIYLSDARLLLHAAKKVLANFSERLSEGESIGDQDFTLFVELLYRSGMVMTGFDGTLFEKGPGKLINNATVAETMMSRANLLTIRMFLHTMARGHRATYSGFGYPYFAEAYRSGGLMALFNRLDFFCEVAETNNSEILERDFEEED